MAAISLGLKAVARVASPSTAAQIRTWIISRQAGLEAAVAGRFATGFTNLSRTWSLRVGEVAPGVFEVYPKLGLTADTTLNAAQLRTRFNNVLADIQSYLAGEVALLANTSILSWHVHVL